MAAQKDSTRAPVPPPKRKLQRKATAAELRHLLIRQFSDSSLGSPKAPEFVTVEAQIEGNGGEVHTARKKVYVTEVNGIRTLDLYSGWSPESDNPHKVPMILQSLPAKVCTLCALERLWVSHNRLTSLPDQIDQLVNLRELFLHRNCLEAVPLQLCKLARLEVLWLNSNKLTSLPNEISQLKTLKRLHLDYNFIEEFPSALCELTSLEVLYMNNNSLRSIPEDIGKLKNLKRLYLQHNKISDIPRGVCLLTNIETLLLDHNEITHIKSDFQVYQTEREQASANISVKNNPFVTPQSKLKLSTGSLHPRTQSLTLQNRRCSQQQQGDKGRLERRARASLPHVQLDTTPPATRKAVTLPRATVNDH